MIYTIGHDDEHLGAVERILVKEDIKRSLMCILERLFSCVKRPKHMIELFIIVLTIYLAIP